MWYNGNMRLCKILNCDSMSRAKGMCPKHYSQERNGHPPRGINNLEPPKCSVGHCTEAAQNFSGEILLCAPHYQLKYRGIDPETRVVGTDGKSRQICGMEECKKRSDTKGYCNYHARRIRTGRTPLPEGCEIELNPKCEFEGCTRPYATKKLCHSHYSQYNSTGNLKPLQDYDKYTRGELRCSISKCRRKSVSTGLCENHKGLQSKYRISPERMIEIWENPRCENLGCTNTKRLHMDHDHVTGDYRGLLCNGCNTGLGFLGENFDRIEGISEYLKRFK